MTDETRPTDRPDVPSGFAPVAVPRLAPAPIDLVPESKLEQAASAILRGIESLNQSEGQIATMLDRAVQRIGEEASVREATRAKVVDANMKLISEAVQGLRGQFDALVPRVTALEGTLPTTAAHFDHMQQQVSDLRVFVNERLELFAVELKAMRDAVQVPPTVAPPAHTP